MYFVSVPYPVNYEDLVDELEELRVGQESVSSPGGATGYTSDPTTRQKRQLFTLTSGICQTIAFCSFVCSTILYS
jgi:hypothetical protein